MQNLAELLPAISRIVGAAVFLLILAGVWYRRRPAVHIPIMVISFVIDVGNVLVIEFHRHAIDQALETSTRSGEWVLKFHILVSVICIAGYVVALATGPVLLRTGKGRKLHRRNALVFLVSRALNCATSFLVGG